MQLFVILVITAMITQVEASGKRKSEADKKIEPPAKRNGLKIEIKEEEEEPIEPSADSPVVPPVKTEGPSTSQPTPAATVSGGGMALLPNPTPTRRWLLPNPVPSHPYNGPETRPDLICLGSFPPSSTAQERPAQASALPRDTPPPHHQPTRPRVPLLQNAPQRPGPPRVQLPSLMERARIPNLMNLNVRAPESHQEGDGEEECHCPCNCGKRARHSK